MKISIIIILFSLCSLGANGQTHNINSIRYQIDTLLCFNDSVLVEISKFENEIFNEKINGYLVSDHRKIRSGRKKLFRKRTIDQEFDIINVIQHGKRTKILKDNVSKVIEYEYDKIQSIRYYNQNGLEISRPEPKPQYIHESGGTEYDSWCDGRYFFLLKK